MIDALDILIQNGSLVIIEAFVVWKDKVCYINNTKNPVSKSFLKKLEETLLSWEQEYIGPSKIDTEEYTVKVICGSSVETYHGKGKYPLNYSTFKELLMEAYHESA